MNLGCNVHASSFVKGEVFEEYSDISEMVTSLGLSGLYAFSYSYPLSVIATFEHQITPEMTGEDFLVLGRSDYERIYKEEENQAGNPGHIPGMLNRARSLGKYGIWGHDFEDLYFEGIAIDEDEYTVTFSIGS